jgi:hypothetical protein
MKNIAYLLIIGGFLIGAFATSLDEQIVNWNLFVIAAFAAIVGVFIAKRQDSAEARSGSRLESNRNELTESISNLASRLEEQVGHGADTGEALRNWIDDTLRTDLRRFADARDSMVHLYGLQTYADIMSEFAAGERYVNRVWSAAADGYDGEARRYLDRAAEQFRHAQTQLTAAASQAT